MSSSPQFISRPPAEIYGRHLGYGFAGAGVNTAIGNFTQTTVDLAFPGGSLGLLDWARTYNSLSGAVGVLGPGWTTTFSAHLVVSEQGVLHHTTGQVTLYDDDGRVLIFLPAPGGGFTRPQDLFGDLAQAADGSFTITYLSGEAWSFSSAGQLTGRSREGQTVTVDYAADGLLSQARHSSGQQLSFAYDSNRRLTQVASGDGRTVSFGYADDGTLMSVTDPGGGTTNFATVTSGPFPQVSSITDADGHQLVVNTYDSGTQQVKTQAFPAGGADFSYGDTGLTTVTSTPSGGQVTFQADANGRMTRVTDPFGNAATFAFDADGLLSQAVAPGGTELSQTHDAAGNLLTNTFGGATTTLTHDDANRVETVTDAVGGVTRYGYTGDSHVPTTVTAPNGGVFTQVIDNGLISAQTDADGHTTSYGHDAAGNLTSLTDPLGHLVQFSYDAAGNRTGFTTASGATAQWTYDQLGRLLSATDPNGALTSYRYSAAGQLLEIADPSGAVTAFAYTAAGLAASITDALGRVTSFGYDDDGNLITITGPMGEVTKASYDALGRMTSLTDPVGGVTALSYDADGNQISEQTPAGTTKVSYDARGNQVSVAAPDGAMARYTFDAADRLTAATGPDGATWTTTYDAAGNIVANRNPLGAVTSQAWTRAGRLVSATGALGRTTSYARDNAGRVTEVTDAEGGVTRYVYDENGRKISATTPAGLVTRFGYDAAGRLIAVTDPRGWITRTQYNARGDKTETIAPDGAISRFSYDAARQLTEVIDPNGSITRYAYDQAGHLASVTDAKGEVTRFGYDNAGRQTSVTDPLGRVTSSAYDNAGNLITVTDPAGHTQQFSYDADRRLIRKTAEGAVDISFTYDAAGRRATMTDATGTTRYAYDAGGHLLTVTEPDGSVTTAGYDAAGQRTSLAYPGGLQTSYTYDGNGRLIALHDSRAGDAVYALDPDGRLLTEQLPGRLARRYHYEGGLVHRFLVIRDGHAVLTADFTRDPNGRIASQHEGDQLTRYRYDAAGQLTSVFRQHLAADAFGREFPHHGPGVSYPRREADGEPDDVLFTYDAAGNRVSRRRNGTDTHYRYDAADQLLGAETSGRRTEYRYDPSGRLAEVTDADRRRLIVYDGFGRPAAVTRTEPGRSERAQATFNGDGLLVALVLTSEDDRRDEQRSASVNYLWGSFGQIPQIIAQRAAPELDDAEHDRPGPLSADFSYGYGRTFGSSEHHAAAFHRDPYGSAVRTEDTAAWVQADRYDTFGAPVRDTEHDRREHQPSRRPGRDHQPGEHRFAEPGRDEPGRVEPPELPRFGYRGELALGPMLDLRARTYDTTLGRFTSRDLVSPLAGPSQAANPYAYANNDPLNAVDPLGTLAFTFTAGGALETFAAAASAPARRVSAMTRMPIGDCPGDPTVATLKQLSRAVQQNNFGLIAGILNVSTSLLFRKPAPPPLQAEVVNTGDSYTCGRFGTGCGNKIVMVPKYNNANTAIPLGAEFWTGFGGRNQYFNQWDPFTQMLMREPWIQETINTLVKSDLQCGVFANSNDYLDPKTHIVGDILGAFTDGRLPGTTDPAVGFLGSYSLDWVAVPTSEKSATVFFTVTNKTDLNSLIHPEFFTFGKVRSVDGARPEFAFLFGPIPGGLFTAIGFRPTTQKIQWQENVGYTYNPAPITP
jgi:RHS repeat-associated protein